MEHNWFPLEFQSSDGEDVLQTAQKYCQLRIQSVCKCCLQHICRQDYLTPHTIHSNLRPTKLFPDGSGEETDLQSESSVSDGPVYSTRKLEEAELMNTAINLMKKNSHNEPQAKNADMLWAEQIGHLFRESQMRKLRSCSSWKYRA